MRPYCRSSESCLRSADRQGSPRWNNIATPWLFDRQGRGKSSCPSPSTDRAISIPARHRLEPPAVSSSLARQPGAAPVAKTVVTSPLGEDVRGVVRLDHVMLGPATAKAVMASVVPDDALCREHRIRGLLGQDVLALSRYTLDFGIASSSGATRRSAGSCRKPWHDAIGGQISGRRPSG